MKALRHELISRNVRISDAANKTQIGLQGKIIDETQATITIKTDSGLRRLLKNNITLELTFQGKRLRIPGKRLFGRPQDRIKKVH